MSKLQDDRIGSGCHLGGTDKSDAHGGRDRLNKRRSELANLQAPQLFEPTKKEKKASDKRIADLKKEIDIPWEIR